MPDAVTTQPLDVVVVGGGIGGLTTALLLTRLGASITVLERSPGATGGGGGILLQPNGLAVLAGLGLADQVTQAGCIMREIRLYGEQGRLVSNAAIPDFGAGLDHLLAIRRSVLTEALLGAVHAEPSISCRLGAVALGCTSDGTVDLRWHGERSTITADLVVGADGVNSAVRRDGRFLAIAQPTGHSYVRGLVPSAEVPLSGEYWTSLGLFGGAPVDAATTYFYAAVDAPPVAGALEKGDLASVARAWTRALPIAGAAFAHVPGVTDLLCNSVVRVDCRVWHDGRLALVGDAAHAMAPTAGQGANSALVDAAVLALGIASEGPLADALPSYTNRRRRAVRRVQDRADLLTRLSNIRGKPTRALRDAGLRAVAGLPGASARSTRAFQQEDPAALSSAVARLGR